MSDGLSVSDPRVLLRALRSTMRKTHQVRLLGLVAYAMGFEEGKRDQAVAQSITVEIIARERGQASRRLKLLTFPNHGLAVAYVSKWNKKHCPVVSAIPEFTRRLILNDPGPYSLSILRRFAESN
jgi:hypothetical protein